MKPLIPSSKKNIYVWVICLSVILVFSQSLMFDFQLIDDSTNTTENPFFQPFGVTSLIGFWSAPYTHLYIPITYSIWGLTANLSELLTGQLTPFFFHALNLFFHTINSLLVFHLSHLILKKVVEDKNDPSLLFYCCIAGLVFAIHPIQVEPVAWVSGFKDINFVFWSLLSSIFYFKWLESYKRSHYIISIFFLIFAVFSKPAAVTLPLILFACQAGLFRQGFKINAYALLPWLLISVAVIASSILFMPSHQVYTDMPFFYRPLVAVDTLFFYLTKVIIPVHFSFDYGRTPEVVTGDTWQVILQALLFFSALLALVIKKKWRFVFFIAILCFAIAPYSGLVSFEFQRISTVADRYAYFLMVIISIATSFFLSRIKLTLLARLLICLIILTIGSISWVQTKAWQNSLTLNAHALTINPYSTTAHVNLGISLASEGQFKRAISHYRKAIGINPENTGALYNLGVAYSCLSNWDDAERQVHALRNLSPDKSLKLERAIRTSKKLIH